MSTQIRCSQALLGRSIRSRTSSADVTAAINTIRQSMSTTAGWRPLTSSSLTEKAPILSTGNNSLFSSLYATSLGSTSAVGNVQLRWKHAARKGNHLEVLDEMAHAKEREQAQERRKKKKERKEKKKNKGKNGAVAASEESSTAENPAQAAADVDFEDDHDDHSDHEEDEVELPDTQKIKNKMMGIVSKYEESLKAIRGAEPTPELFDDILVHAYGSENTPLKTVAQVVITSPTMASITCFDPALVKEVRNSILQQLGLNSSEGDDVGVLKVPLPKVSMETRQKTAAQLGKRAENFCQKIRRVRRRYNNIIKAGKEGKLEGISKDDVFRVAQEIDDVTEQAVKKLNDINDKKHKSIMDIWLIDLIWRWQQVLATATLDTESIKCCQSSDAGSIVYSAVGHRLLLYETKKSIYLILKMKPT